MKKKYERKEYKEKHSIYQPKDKKEKRYYTSDNLEQRKKAERRKRAKKYEPYLK